MNLTIKNVPEKVYDGLKRSAAEHARSLNAEIVRVLADLVDEGERRRRMATSRRELERFVAAMPLLSSSVPLIRAERQRR